ncbi:mechanosensitive ion channel family protein [Marinibaculum pumilum]|uniref:Mechanosensitive ion channel family protein n=1 Tax=Marinibaculum pumilum TaxID=1766165 RepID=A0ABV7KVA1_9PROT
MNREDYDRFWTVVMEVWNEGIFGASVGNLVTALLIFLLFLVLRGLFARWVIGLVQRYLARRGMDLAGRVVDAMAEPLKLIPVIAGLFFAIEHLRFSTDATIVADRLIRSMIVFAVFWALFRMVDPARYLFRRLEELLTAELVDWMMKALKVVIAILGGATILETWGVDVMAVLAGFGLVGAAVALGAQDLFKNLIGGLLIMAEKRFARGDWISVDGVVEGTVEKIGFRSTLVRRFDKAPVFVPNNSLSDQPVVNFSKMTFRRIYWTIGVTYSTTVPQLRAIRDEIEAYILENPAYVRPEEASTFVRIDKFNDSSIDIMLYCFTVTTNWGRWLELKEELAYTIMDIVLRNGSSFAFPSQSVYLEQWPHGDRPELFVPPSADGRAALPAPSGGQEGGEGR